MLINPDPTEPFQTDDEMIMIGTAESEKTFTAMYPEKVRTPGQVGNRSELDIPVFVSFNNFEYLFFLPIPAISSNALSKRQLLVNMGDINFFSASPCFCRIFIIN